MKLGLRILCLLGLASASVLPKVDLITKDGKTPKNELHGEDLIEFINKEQNLWKAETNKFTGVDLNQLRPLMGVLPNGPKLLPKPAHLTTVSLEDLPKNFDARKKWKECKSIGTVFDQSACGSCWAFGAVEAMSDRACISSISKVQPIISASDLMSCCSSCGSGCNGGWPASAWLYWKQDGIVTGGKYKSHNGCISYPFPPCEHHTNKTHYPQCPHELYRTPSCLKNCDKKVTETYSKEKHFGKEVYNVNGEETMRKEIYENGPIEVAFDVYADFLAYKSGIYKHTTGPLLGGHAVKIIGWGEENGVLYWTVVNSWNEDWGDNGLFRIIRGVDECGIESETAAGIPDLKRSEKL